MKLVMIGTFKNPSDATKMEHTIEELVSHIEHQVDVGAIKLGEYLQHFPDGTREVLAKHDLNTIGAYELEQFAYDVSHETTGSRITLRTDEADMSAFLKVLITKGARVEVYSAHDHS
jgi:hypothetical protein